MPRHSNYLWPSFAAALAMNYTNTQATPDDVLTLQALSRQTFADAFTWYNTPADMQHYLENDLSTTQLSKELTTPNTHFFLAWDGDKAIGYSKLEVNTVPDGTPGTAIEIARLYVLETYHGSGAGQQLFQHALDKAKREGATTLWLGVWELNPRAIRFYEKNGMAAFGTQTFQLGSDLQRDITMKRPV